MGEEPEAPGEEGPRGPEAELGLVTQGPIQSPPSHRDIPGSFS